MKDRLRVCSTTVLLTFLLLMIFGLSSRGWAGGWSSLGSGMGNRVYALAHDGSGNLYAGGAFFSAGGVMASRIAKWNGSNWSALGSGMNDHVHALARDGAGNLYAGGVFLTAGGGAASRIAKWNGSNWSSLGSGMNTTVYALAHAGGNDLYAGGTFSTAGGVSANRIAKWNGSSWSALGSGMNGIVYALAYDGSGNLYAGGDFTTAGGVSSPGIAKWNGSSWSPLGSYGLNTVYALAYDGAGNLYAGGEFTWAGSVEAKYIARWNGSNWSPLGSGMGDDSPYVRALALDGAGTLYAGGDFTTAGGLNANRIAKWETPRMYMPAGGTRINGLDFDTYILIANPNDTDARVEVRFIDDLGPVSWSEQTVGAKSRSTVKMNDRVGNNRPAVSTIVTSLNDVPVICERAMYWTSGGVKWIGGHDTLGIGNAATEWYLAEGATHIFDQFIHVLNPDKTKTATVEVIFSDQNGQVGWVESSMPPQTNWTVNAKAAAGERPQVSTYVRSKNSVPIAVDRTMYWDKGGIKWIDGHASLGVNSPAQKWYLAEGATHIFDEYVMVYNPSTSQSANVNIGFMDAGGNVIPNNAVVGPRARYTVKVNNVVGALTQVSTVVDSSLPVVAERAMYWTANGVQWHGGHGTVGVPQAATTWYLPEGATHTFDQYVLVANPDPAQSANVTFTFSDQFGNSWTHQAFIEPQSRFTVKANNVVGPVSQVSTVVNSDIPVVAERAMYWNPGGIKWGGGHATVGVPEE